MVSLWLATRPGPVAAAPPDLGGSRRDVVVIGAGLTGLATAVLLAGDGHQVTVLEARRIGAVATGNTTGKLSLLQGSVLSRIRHRHGAELAAAYVQGNAAGQAWLTGFLADRGVGYAERTAYSYATTEAGRRRLDRELAASAEAGLPVDWDEHPGLPYEVEAAIALPGQVQFHPMDVLAALVAELQDLGGQVVTGVRVQGLDGVRLQTSAGEVTAEHIVVATGFPVIDRTAHFARLAASRSYLQAFEVVTPLPQGMYLSVDDPSRSLRTASVAGKEYLLVGGNSHPVGRHPDPAALVADLQDWTRQHFPGALRTHAWSAQDYQSATLLPVVTDVPGTHGRVLLATGYNKWGLTNAVTAALRLAARVRGTAESWAELLDRARLAPGDLGAGVRFNAEVAGAAVAGWAGTLQPLPEHSYAEGEGHVGLRHGRPTARARTEAGSTSVSAICTHLGGVLAWNDAECSWDCPLHGSRFAPDGSVLEGPATRDLERLD